MTIPDNNQISHFRLQKTTEAKFADFERSQGAKIVTINDIHWRQVRPFFFRPLLPFREYAPEAVTPPLLSHIGGCEFAVPKNIPANSRLNMLIFQNVEAYSLTDLGRGRRRQIMSAAKVFAIREITDVNEFKEKAYPIYVSFYQRTEYKYKRDRLNQLSFSRWAESLFQYGKFLILGAYRNEKLEATWTCQLVEDTVISMTAFSTSESQRLNVNSLLIHSVREASASSGQAKQIFVGMYKYGAAHGVDDFYLERGCSLVQMPARLRINPLAAAALRVFLPADLRRLRGILTEAHADTEAGMGSNPAGLIKGSEKPTAEGRGR